MIAFAMIFIRLTKGFDTSHIGFRDALLFATLTWLVMGVLGSVPITLVTNVSITHGIFESISGLTTTGATVLSELDEMPRTFLLYRQFLQWLGGLGTVIFVVAVLPMLNVGGMKLLKAETPEPVKSEELSPRISSSAHYLLAVYLVLTFFCSLSYRLAGMNTYDAIAHSLSTVSTGGFSTYDLNMGAFGSPLIMAVTNVFMLLGAISFALHFKAIKARSVLMYWQDEETRVFLWIVLALSTATTYMLLHFGTYTQFLPALNNGVFHLISFISGTGFFTIEFTAWPGAIALLLIFAAYLGGCAGSTAGGNKIIRNILAVKLVALELKRMIHPRGVFTILYQDKIVESSVLGATLAFLSITAVSSLVLTLLLMATGLDFWIAFTAVAACLNVLGPAFSELGNNFSPLSDTGIWILTGALILGRLEYFAVIGLLLPRFWRW